MLALRLETPNVPAQPPVEARPSAASPHPEAALLSAVATGDTVAFRALVATHLSAAVAIARGVLGDAVEAEDVAQEAFLRLWRNAATLDVAAGGVKPWLRRVVSNLCIDRIRSRRNTTVTDAVPEQLDRPRQGEDLEDADLSRRVQAALQGLPERQRLALVMFHFEGLSQVEVGHALGISDEAVESLLARGRRALKGLLKDEWQALLPDARD